MVHYMICEGVRGVSLVLRKVRMFGGTTFQYTTIHFEGRGAYLCARGIGYEKYLGYESDTPF